MTAEPAESKKTADEVQTNLDHAVEDAETSRLLRASGLEAEAIAAAVAMAHEFKSLNEGVKDLVAKNKTGRRFQWILAVVCFCIAGLGLGGYGLLHKESSDNYLAAVSTCVANNVTRTKEVKFGKFQAGLIAGPHPSAEVRQKVKEDIRELVATYPQRNCKAIK